ncbi:DUF748 domain-containing protein [Rubrivivax gelatinosus]|uniref:DUF748 domain-containing protein n=1 Tax=Rubrivivax gelatinosus (strain NBRC 100245 / IL144) TaxID=983917 RepID=I0HRU3_RUBGI|nr:DUF748 domain-containing protein [Rubrivivax gelatinosus]BAL95730.1 hypothetical protein RGE_23890 [Rubrivivax gelatinosus IL144]
MKKTGGWTRLAATLLAGAVLLALVAWIAVPRLVKAQLEQQGSALLGRGLHVESVSFSPLTLTLELRGLVLDAAAGDADRSPQARVERLALNLSSRSLWARIPVIEALDLDSPSLRLARTAEGRYDVDDLIERLSEPSAPGTPPARFALYNLSLRDGSLRFDDRPEGQRHLVDAVSLGLPFVSNEPDQVQAEVEPRLSLRLDGSPLHLQGRSRPFSAERVSTITVDLPALALDSLWPYLPRSLPLRGQGGVLSGKLELRFAQPAGQPAQLSLQGQATLASLALRRPDGAPLVAWKSLAVEIEDLRPLERVVALRSVVLDSAVLHLRRDAAGRLELAALGGAPAAAQPAAPAWRWSVGSSALRAATLHWEDASLRPAASLEARELSLQVGRLSSADPAPAPLSGSLRLAAAGDGGAELGRLKLDGKLSTASAALGVEVEGLQLAAAAPYLRSALTETPSGRLGGRAEVDWAAGEPGRLLVKLPQAAVEDLRWGRQRLAALKLAGVQADLGARRVAVDSLALENPALDLARDARGQWNVLAMLKPAGTPATADRGPGWQASLKSLSVSAGSLHLADAATPAPVGFALQALALKARDLQWPSGKRPASLDLSLNLVPDHEPGTPAPTPGRLQAEGTLALQPLAWRGRVSVARLPLQVAEPYWRERLPVLVRRAELGWRGDTEFRMLDAGPALSLRGNAMLADLRVLARGDDDEAGDELLAWQSLRVESLAASMAPGQPTRLATGPVRLSRFFSRLVVTPEGRLNLRDVRGGDAPAPATPAATSSPAAPLELDIAGVEFVDGRVDFRDRFIQPNYSASLSELNGKLGRLRSGTREMATLEITGRAADTATLELRGALNPTADPLALDIAAKASGLELAPLSPYAGKYAGYAIERGKLSMDVAYRVDADGRLQARNRIVLNQLTFGDPVDSPVATKLPVRLALALLADRNGVIDVDLPISGSINDPEFSVFGLVLKVIGNLLVKAVTSPFALLSGGGGDETGAVEFLPGTATLAPSAEEALDRIAQALKDRPALQTTVAGAADATAEHDAIQAATLEERLRSEQARERARSRGVGPGAAVPATEERERTLRRVYADTRLPNKPRNLIGLAKDIPPAEMEALLKAAVSVDADVARDLALRRGVAVREALVARGLPAERLFLAAPKLDAAEGQTGWTPQVELSLEMP